MSSNNYSPWILTGIENIKVGEEVKHLLVNLVEIESNIFENDREHAINIFYNTLSQKVNSYEVENLQPADPKVSFVQECIKWTIDNWALYTTCINIQKSILVHSILEYFHISNSCLNCAHIDPDYIKKIEDALSDLDFSITVPDDAPYSAKKAYEEFLNDINNNKFNKIISIMDHMVPYHGLNIFLTSLIKIAFKICPNSFARFLSVSNNKPFLVKSIIDVLDEATAFDFFVNQYNEQGVFALVFFFVSKLKENFHSLTQQVVTEPEFNADEYCLIMSKIIERLDVFEPINFLHKNLNLSINNNYHLILGKYIARNNKYAEEYVNTINFELSENTGAHFWKGFTENLENEENLNVISFLVDQKYNQYCIKKPYLRPHQYNGYLNFIYKSIHTRCSSIEKYSAELESIISEIEKQIISWDFSKLAYCFHKFFLLITVNPVFLHYNMSNEIFSKAFTFLRDCRLKAIFNEEVYSLSSDCMANPLDITSIITCDNAGNKIELAINRGEQNK